MSGGTRLVPLKPCSFRLPCSVLLQTPARPASQLMTGRVEQDDTDLGLCTAPCVVGIAVWDVCRGVCIMSLTALERAIRCSAGHFV